MKCLINFAQKIDFQNESLTGVKSCLFIKAHKYIKSTTDSGINEEEDGTYTLYFYFTDEEGNPHHRGQLSSHKGS